MNRTKILLFLLLLSLLLANGRTPTAPVNDVTQPTAPPVTEASPTPVASATPSPTSVFGLGQLWAGISQWDAGHCPGYGMPSGNGSPPSLSWPVDSRAVNEGRPFSTSHSGIDIYAAEGAAVYASATGRAIWAGMSTYGLGETVAISHGGGWYTLYSHLAAVMVDCGEWVYRGDVIGLVGMSGNSDYVHLHWELRRGRYSFNPLG